MKISVKESSEIVRTLEIEVPQDQVMKAYEQAFSRVASAASFPGFRKGKAPRNLVEKRFGRDVEQETLQGLLPQATFDAVKQENLRMVGQPVIENLDFAPTKPLSFKARIEIMPVVKLKGSLEGFKLTATKAEATDAEVDEQVQGLRERQGVVGEEVARPAAMGDHLLVDFEGRIDNVPFQGGSANDFQITLGRRQLIPGFEEGLVGVKKGETRQIKVSFPDDYPGREVAGKPAEFTVSVKEVKAVILPEVNDEFAKSLGGVETALEMKAAIRKTIEATKARIRKAKLQEEAAGQLLETHACPVPTAMIDAEVNLLIEREINSLRSRGMEIDGENAMKQLQEKARPAAEKRARLALILEAAADKQGITVSEEEYLADLERAAPQLGTTVEALKAQLARDGRDRGLKARLREEKALEWIVSKAQIKEV